MDLEIEHDEELERFHADVPGGVARLDYRRKGDDVVDFRSTYVPDEARGEGVAGKIVSRAFGWAEKNDLRVVPSCSYVRDWVDRHPEHQDRVVEG